MTGLDNHLEKGISFSALNLVARSPAHYKLRYIDGVKKPPTPAMLLGSLIHTAVLEPGKLDGKYAVAPDLNKNSKAYKEWKAGQTATIINQSDLDTAHAIAKVVRDHPIAGPLLEQADHTEKTIQWRDRQTGVFCQGTLDLVTGLATGPRSLIVDLKTTRDARADPFSKSMVDFRYDVQGAYYWDGGVEQGWPIEKFMSIAVETEAPYLVAVYALGQETLDLARAAYTHDLWLWQQCVESGEWPGLEAKITVVDLPPWGRKLREQTRGGK
jgi:exodeoxyribonuclease VIII